MSVNKHEQLATVMAKANSDDAFRAKLLADAHTALSELGIDVPEGKTINFVENTSDTMNIILPPMPIEGELSETELADLAGGVSATGGQGANY